MLTILTIAGAHSLLLLLHRPSSSMQVLTWLIRVLDLWDAKSGKWVEGNVKAERKGKIVDLWNLELRRRYRKGNKTLKAEV